MTRFDHSRDKTIRARTLRRDMTDCERRLWLHLRNGTLGVSFRRQHAVGPYFADFAAPSIGLVIEIDGGQHGFDENAHREAQRTAFLEARGFRVLRFWNHEIIGNLDGVRETIWNEVQQLGRSR